MKVIKKLRSRSGETLAEVLVALLIIVLAVAVMVVMINTAASIDINTRGRDKAFYEELTNAETRVDSTSSGTIRITVDGDASADRTIGVEIFGGDKLNSYKKPAGGAP